jgi:integrase
MNDQIPSTIAAAVPAPLASTPGGRQSYLEFFIATIRNRYTRRNYLLACNRFLTWAESRGLQMRQITAVVIATYLEQLAREVATPTVRLHLAAIRELFAYLTVTGVIPFSPATVVRGPKYSVRTGKTPVLTAEQTRQLFEAIDTSSLIGLRDRALIATMAYTFARISATLNLKVEDYREERDQRWLRLHEKGGKVHDVPCHPQLVEYLDAWIAAAGLGQEHTSPLFRAMQKGNRLGQGAIDPPAALRVIKHRALAAGLPASTCCHTFRATGITTFIQNGGSLEHARYIANHASTDTTKLYDRTSDTVTAQEIEKVRI